MITIAPLNGFKRGGNGRHYAEITQSFHPHIEASITYAITDTVVEWRRHLLDGRHQPLDSSSVAARNLVTIFDFFLSYGFNRGNRLYWVFVKEFMSRNEIDYLKREWRVTSTRQLSVAWLKDVLNKQTLLYHFQSFQQDIETVRKFYHKEAVMTDQSLLSRVVQKMIAFTEVQFKFLKPFERRNNIPIAIMRHGNQRPSTSSGSSAVLCRYSRELESRSAIPQESRLQFSTHSQDVSPLLLDVPLPADFVETHTTSFDKDIAVPENDSDQIFGELLKRRKSESADSIHCCLSKEDALKNTVDEEKHTVSSAVVSTDPFDIALKTSLSKAKLSVEDIHFNECEYRTSPITTLVDLPCGEIRLDMGEMIGLSMNVFKHDAERFMRLFQVYSHFGTGEIERRLFALSNQAAYLLSAENFITSKKSYVTRAYLPLRYISSVHVGPDWQVMYLHAEKDYNVCEAEDDKFLSVVEICMACKQLGITILDALNYAYENYVSNFQLDKIKLKVCPDPTPQYLIRFISKELHKDAPVLYGYYLAQWRQMKLYSMNGDGYQHSGFLYHKEVGGGVSWLLGSGDFQQSYFHLQNKKIYQFSDSTCKFGERVISVRDSVIDVVELKGDDRSPHMFEVVLKNSRIQFICQSAADMHKWISLITLAITSTDMDDEPAACVVCLCESILIAQEGLNCAADGFMRLLARIDMTHISQATGVFAAERSACVIKNEDKLEWLFMRSPDEVDRMLEQLNKLGVRQINTEEGGSSRLSAILNSMSRLNDAFQFDDVVSDDTFDTSLELR
ncbi:Uncharacterized protein BM_BM9641 [Brugia malayi]|uniref:PH domain-containing protein n=1 Tax=Brugia malayi TaxID=6279 RepID=A0A4E9EVS7_BRUMA|nr:Uncharacterized protein BM_BM9641 [Brugia malayi]VIO86985.1 Uncharacterized protein BM_BM9641 [Brugia malayi]